MIESKFIIGFILLGTAWTRYDEIRLAQLSLVNWTSPLPPKISLFKNDRYNLDLSQYINLYALETIDTSDCPGVTFQRDVDYHRPEIIQPYTPDDSIIRCKVYEKIPLEYTYLAICYETFLVVMRENNSNTALVESPISIDLATKLGSDELRPGACLNILRIPYPLNKIAVLCSVQGENDKIMIAMFKMTEDYNSIKDINVISGDTQTVIRLDPKLIQSMTMVNRGGDTYLIYLNKETNHAFFTKVDKNGKLVGKAWSLLETEKNYNIPAQLLSIDVVQDFLVIGYLDVNSPKISPCFVTANAKLECGESVIIRNCFNQADLFLIKAERVSNKRTFAMLFVSKSCISYDEYFLDKQMKPSIVNENESSLTYFPDSTLFPIPFEAIRFNQFIVVSSYESSLMNTPPRVIRYWTSTGNLDQIDVKESFGGRAYFFLDGFRFNRVTMLYFGEAALRIEDLTEPNLSFSGEGLQGNDTLHVSCTMNAKYYNRKKPAPKELRYSMIMNSKLLLKLDTPLIAQGYTNSELIIPFFDEEFYGNAPRFKAEAWDLEDAFNGEFTFLYNNELVDKSSGEAELMLGEASLQESINGFKIIWVGSIYYILDANISLILMKCPKARASLEIECRKVGVIAKSSISENGDVVLRSADIGIDELIILYNSGEKGGIYFYNIIKAEESLNHNLEYNIVASDIQIFNGIVFSYIISSSNGRSRLWVISFPKKTNYTKEDLKPSQELVFSQNLCPKRIEFFPHFMDSLMIYSECNSESNTQKLMFQYSFLRSQPEQIKLTKIHNIKKFKTPLFCLTTGYIHILDMAEPQKLSSFDSDLEETGYYSYPLEEFSSIGKIVNLACDSQREMIHLLAENKNNPDKRLIVSLRGEAQNQPEKRIHSITEVDKGINTLTAGSHAKLYESIILYADSVLRVPKIKALSIQPYSPSIIGRLADIEKETKGKIEVTMSSFEDSIKESYSTIFISTIRFITRGSLTLKKNKGIVGKTSKFPLKINFEDILYVGGLIKSLEFNSKIKANKLIQRVGFEKKIEPLSLRENTEGVLMIGEQKPYLVWTNNSANVYLNHKPQLSKMISGEIMGSGIVTGRDGRYFIFMLVKETLYQSLHVIYGIEGNWKHARSSNSIDINQSSSYFSESIKDGYFVMVSMNNYLAFQITYNSFQINEEVVTFQESPYRRYFPYRIYSLSAVTLPEGVVTIALVGNTKKIYIGFGATDLSRSNHYFREIKSDTYTSGGQYKAQISHPFSQIACQALKEQSVKPTIRCFIATEEVYSFFFRIALNPKALLPENIYTPGITLLDQDDTIVEGIFMSMKDFFPMDVAIAGKTAAVSMKKSSFIKSTSAVTKEDYLVALFHLDNRVSDAPLGVIMGSDVSFIGRDRDASSYIHVSIYESNNDNASKINLVVASSGSSLFVFEVRNTFTLILTKRPEVEKNEDSIIINSVGSDPFKMEFSELFEIEPEDENHENDVPDEENTLGIFEKQKKLILLLCAGIVALVVISSLMIFLIISAKKKLEKKRQKIETNAPSSNMNESLLTLNVDN